MSKVKPIVAIVGRPNVGKSSLFNRIIGWRKAIVDDIPGVTRDRNYADVDWSGIEFTLVDTGGFELETDDLYLSLLGKQVRIAIEEADLLLFLLDGQTGVMPQDSEVLNLLRKSDKPVLYVVNKIDHEKHEIRTVDFHTLGIEDIVSVSSEHGRKINELLDTIVLNVQVEQSINGQVDEVVKIRIAVIGKPNVGKSTLINRIIGEERLLTSPLPGTTRDSVDIEVENNGKKYILIDTAGMRRKSKIKFAVERYSVMRAVRAIERSDIVLHMIDSQDGPTLQDSHLSDLIKERGRGCIILLNKWDLVPREIADTPNIQEFVRDKLKATDFAFVLLISAITGRNISKIFSNVDSVYENLNQRIPTKKLNTLLEGILTKSPPPLFRGKEIKFYYISQPMTDPPTFVIFTNSSKGVQENYKRFLERIFREEFQLEGTPIKFLFRTQRKGKLKTFYKR
ncbi:ribosome biogenesis GTPase Der [Desulfobacterota bacterium AH_259_B03_O07]|nr:ribosome biogenesis GTPase Der [Desulfobacterota bacterium AH_259_B03_O07]